MIRLFLRSISINLASIYISSLILSGVIVYIGGYKTLLIAATAITVANLIVKPLVHLLLLPIHLLTLGAFRWVANLITLYLITWLVPNLQIRAFTAPEINLTYLMIPSIHFSAFAAFIVATLTLTLVFHFIYWLLQD
jgi:putative membrane protein